MAVNELNNAGTELFLNNDLEGARAHYLAALGLEPNYSPVLCNIASLLASEEKLGAAITCLRRALIDNTEDIKLLTNLGNCLTRAGHFTEAERLLLRANDLSPKNWAILHNLGLLYYKMRQPDLAGAYFQEVIQLGHDTDVIRHDLSLALLANGKLHEGLKRYEARWGIIDRPNWMQEGREWKGENLKGKSLALYAEQGFGDMIMMARVAQNLTERGASVFFVVHPALHNLFQHQGWNITDAPLKCDYFTPTFSSLYWLGLEYGDISPKPYITSPRLSAPQVSSLYNVGLCWASGVYGNGYYRRHIPLEICLRLAETPKVKLYSLQKDGGAEIKNIGAEALIEDVMPSCRDWADTAAFVAKLDLVITVDTAIAHLAGAMGKKVIMLAQASPCWRWQNVKVQPREGTGWPWYENMQVIKQETQHSWFQEVETANMLMKEAAANA